MVDVDRCRSHFFSSDICRDSERVKDKTPHTDLYISSGLEEYSWVIDEVLDVPSLFTWLTRKKGYLCTYMNVAPSKDWEACLPEEGRKVCSVYNVCCSYV